jgi:hypothetical protein
MRNVHTALVEPEAEHYNFLSVVELWDRAGGASLSKARAARVATPQLRNSATQQPRNSLAESTAALPR